MKRELALQLFVDIDDAAPGAPLDEDDARLAERSEQHCALSEEAPFVAVAFVTQVDDLGEPAVPGRIVRFALQTVDQEAVMDLEARLQGLGRPLDQLLEGLVRPGRAARGPLLAGRLA